jgi:hypothetical protein
LVSLAVLSVFFGIFLDSIVSQMDELIIDVRFLISLAFVIAVLLIFLGGVTLKLDARQS